MGPACCPAPPCIRIHNPSPSHCGSPGATSRVRCPLRGVNGRCSSRLLYSPLHYAKRNENRPILRPVVSCLGPAKVCLSCPPSMTYTLTFLRFLPPAPPFWHLPLAKILWFRCTPDGLYLSAPSHSLTPPLQLKHIHSLLNKSGRPPFLRGRLLLSPTTLSTTDRTDNRDTPL